MKIVITGGHHTSALPVIKELCTRKRDVEIFWFGHKHTLAKDKNVTLEYLDITNLKIPFYNIHAGKFYKTFNLIRLLKIPVGFFQSLYLLLKIKPDVILSFGGYIAVPVCTAGKLLGIRIITHEQTLVSGYANRLISKIADKVLISWEDSKKFFKRDVVCVGLPLREEIFQVLSNDFYVNPDLKTFYITAGKTGSIKINKLIYDNLENLLENFNLIHQCGDYSESNDYDKLLSKYNDIKHIVKGSYNLKKFIFNNQIGEVFSKCDYIISRSGAHITSEILALSKPAILIPIPWVSHNEQYINAEFIVKKGLGEIFHEKDIGKVDFVKFVLEFSYKFDGFKKVSEVKRLDSAKLIVDNVLDVSK